MLVSLFERSMYSYIANYEIRPPTEPHHVYLDMQQVTSNPWLMCIGEGGGGLLAERETILL